MTPWYHIAKGNDSFNPPRASCCSQSKEDSRPSMAGSLPAPPAPRQHDPLSLLRPHRTSLYSLNRPCSIPLQAFAHSLTKNILPSPPLFGSQLSHHLLTEASQDLPDQTNSSPITCSHGTMYFSSVAAAVSHVLCNYWVPPLQCRPTQCSTSFMSNHQIFCSPSYPCYSTQYLDCKKLSINTECMNK